MTNLNTNKIFCLLIKNLRELSKKLINRLVLVLKIYVFRDELELEYKRWIADKGDEKLRYDYPNLNENSIVFDVGGFVGDFAAKIHEKYGCEVFVFEPHPEFYYQCLNRFSNNPKITILNYGLADKDGIFDLTDSVDGSSFSKPQKNNSSIIRCRCAEFFSVLNEFGITHINLMKINIEGGEYPLLQHILKHDRASLVGDYQIQFHNFANESKLARNKITKALSKSHKLSWCYNFIWENWEKH
ncbi:FkbM family methyltransferase [Planktomarina sp.]|nr:FkbM family methyltransferase [Planktomarina sp.]